MATWMVMLDLPSYEVLLATFDLWGIDGVGFLAGEEALAWIESVDAGQYVGAIPEIALMELWAFGDLRGDHVAARIRRSPALKDMTIILGIGCHMNSEEYQNLVLRANADGYLHLPWPRFHELERLLEDIHARKTQ